MSKYINFRRMIPSGDWRNIVFTPAFNYIWLYKPRNWVFDERAGEYRLFVEGIDEYPWVDADNLPVLGKIIFETERYITLEIQPHEHRAGSNVFSQPYKHTIHKADLMNGRFMIKPIEYVGDWNEKKDFSNFGSIDDIIDNTLPVD